MQRLLKRISDYLFSFRLAGMLSVLLAVSIAVATFVENDFGAEAARARVYNTGWFEFLFVLSGINLLGNMIINRVYLKGKLSIYIFHLSFILILAGAAITRLTGFTGVMHIRVNTEYHVVTSDENRISLKALRGERVINKSKTIYLSENITPGRLLSFRLDKNSHRISYLDQLSDARPVFQFSADGKPAMIFAAVNSFRLKKA